MKKEKKISKPSIFISHAVSDYSIAKEFKTIIETVYAGAINVFLSSDGDIRPGKPSFAEILSSIKKASIVIILLSRESVNRAWILFETGIAVHREIAIPICIKGFWIEEEDSLISNLQCLNGEIKEDIQKLFQEIDKTFNLSGLKNCDLESFQIAISNPYDPFSFQEIAKKFIAKKEEIIKKELQKREKNPSFVRETCRWFMNDNEEKTFDVYIVNEHFNKPPHITSKNNYWAIRIPAYRDERNSQWIPLGVSATGFFDGQLLECKDFFMATHIHLYFITHDEIHPLLSIVTGSFIEKRLKSIP